jgi:6-pyruvoyltetrahydropterin/6-carboxytetrahydropterin synthase
MKIGREFYFDAAHFLPEYRVKCEKLHGHTYKLEVVVEGEVEEEEGMVLDFDELKKVVEKKVLRKLDHRNLNDLFEKSTAEKIAEWIFKELKEELPLYSVKLWEGKGKWVLIEKK